jgi:hypothetical protein
VDFEEYLRSKKIDPVAFRAREPERWSEWKAIFDQVSPASFTTQKLYLINPTRRKYPLAEVVPAPEAATPAAPAPAKPKPVMRPKIS